MAKRKYKVSLSRIEKEITKAEKALRALATRVSDKDKKKIKLEIKALAKVNRSLAGFCTGKSGRMTQVFASRMTGCPKS